MAGKRKQEVLGARGTAEAPHTPTLVGKTSGPETLLDTQARFSYKTPVTPISPVFQAWITGVAQR